MILAFGPWRSGRDTRPALEALQSTAQSLTMTGGMGRSVAAQTGQWGVWFTICAV
jgi:hypothetical protein